MYNMYDVSTFAQAGHIRAEQRVIWLIKRNSETFN